MGNDINPVEINLPDFLLWTPTNPQNATWILFWKDGQHAKYCDAEHGKYNQMTMILNSPGECRGGSYSDTAQ